MLCFGVRAAEPLPAAPGQARRSRAPRSACRGCCGRPRSLATWSGRGGSSPFAASAGSPLPGGGRGAPSDFRARSERGALRYRSFSKALHCLCRRVRIPAPRPILGSFLSFFFLPSEEVVPSEMSEVSFIREKFKNAVEDSYKTL